MKNKLCSILIVFVFLSGFFIQANAQQHTIRLHFNKAGLFKIAQLTDIHWDNNNKELCNKSKKAILNVLNSEKPDLVIITGDVVWKEAKKEGWKAIGAIFADAKIPWAVTLGNHDSEGWITRKGIFSQISHYPYFVGKAGPALYGQGNYCIPIMAYHQSRISSVLYCFDSNDYPSLYGQGNYDWIKPVQINWYRKCSDRYRSLNHGVAIPSLAFFHIPLPEFKDIVGMATMVGKKKDPIDCPVFNSGLFTSFIEKKDVMGVFVGHDHNNDFIGIDHGIALAYGQKTGYDCYGDLPKGGRIILLYQDKTKFDTWIRSVDGTDFYYYYPTGSTEPSSENNIPKSECLPSCEVKGLVHGIRYRYYQGKKIRSVEQIVTEQKLVKKGVLKGISLSPATAKDSVSFIYDGWIKIPQKSLYSFYLYSDDGSKLLIDDLVVVDNDGSHSGRYAERRMALDKGFHKFKLLYFQSYMGMNLEAGMSSSDMRKQPIPDNLLYIKSAKYKK